MASDTETWQQSKDTKEQFKENMMSLENPYIPTIVHDGKKGKKKTYFKSTKSTQRNAHKFLPFNNIRVKAMLKMIKYYSSIQGITP